MDDDLLFDDPAFDDGVLLEELENNLGLPPSPAQAQQQQPNQFVIDNDDEFDDQFGDDLDLEELVQVEQQATNTNHDRNISFVPDEGDPLPPPRLPPNTQSFHPLDLENLRTWIYPTNYPIRGYQYNIVQKALFSNTLVALPTGLGKTFIAAVVMYNYWRWFPNSKIIFMAPTRPLVTQQIEACFSICGLPQDDTVDISGTTTPAKRKDYWKSKRVFFATPQTIQNDLQSNSCPAEKVVCVVVDEAHRATGNYAFVNVIKKLLIKNKEFRVLALTATPGSRIETVQNVVNNLKIANIKIRTEESMDIIPFTYGKNIKKVIVKLTYTEGGTGLVPRVLNEFKSQVFQPILDQLEKLPSGIYVTDAERVTTYGLTANRNTFTLTANNINKNLKFYITSMYLVAEQMSRAYDMLSYHGIAPFIESIENSIQEQQASGRKMTKPQAQYYNNPTVKRLLIELKREMLTPNFSGHPKIDQLVAILLKHFTNLPVDSTSKVMVFSSFRSSVTEICRVLDHHNPLIRPSYFVGQSDSKMGNKGLKQKEQQEVIQKFKRDIFNVLVATSIGEEGLDIGEIDLIICYDSQTSPIRMLQRIGRTGRKRQGKCIMLLTEIEERKYNQAKETYNRIQRQISQGTDIHYYKENPTIIPSNYRPTICRKVLDIGEYKQQLKKRKRLGGAASVFAIPNPDFETSTGFLKQDKEQAFVKSFNTHLDTFANLHAVIDRYWPISNSLNSLKKYVPLQTEPKPTYRVGHSSRTIQFTAVVKKMEHRILYPDEEIKFDVPKKRQTTLILPIKIGGTGGKGTTTLMMPKRKGKNKATAALDDALNEFMDQTGVAQFMDYDTYDDVQNDYHGAYGDALYDGDFEDTQKNKVHDFFAPKSPTTASTSKEGSPLTSSKLPINKSAATSTAKSISKPALKLPYKSPSKSPSIKDKGKGKMPATEEDSFDMIDTDWQPILPDEVYETVEPFMDRQLASATELKIKKQWKQPAPVPRSPPTTPPIAEEKINLDPPPSVYIKKESTTRRRLVQNDEEDEEDNDEFGILDDDFPVDDLFIAETEAMMLQGFDDAIEPKFPFEKQQQEEAIGVALIWNGQSKPRFSKKALTLLDQRQNELHEVTGKFVAMSLYAKYNQTNSKPLNFLPAVPVIPSKSITTPDASLILPKPIAMPKYTVASPKLSNTANVSWPPLSVSRPPSLPASRTPSLPPSIPTSPQQSPLQTATVMDNCEDDQFDRAKDDLLVQAAVSREDIQQHHEQDDDMISIHNSDTSSDEEDGFDNINFNEMTFADFLDSKVGFDENNGTAGLKKQQTTTNNHDPSSQLMKKKVSLYSKPSPSKKKQLYKSPSPPPQQSIRRALPQLDDLGSQLENFTHYLSPPPMVKEKSKSFQNANRPSPSPPTPPPIVGEDDQENEIMISSQPIVDDEDGNSVILISETTPQRDNAITPIRSSNSTHKKDKKSPNIPQKYGSPSPTRILPQLSKGLYPPSASPLANSPLRLGKLPPRTPSPKLDSSRYRSPLGARNSLPLGTPARQIFSPLGKRTNATSDSEDSPLMPVIRRKRRIIEVSPNTNLDEEEGEDDKNAVLIPGSKPKKRLKRKASTPSINENFHLFEEEDEDNEDLVFVPPSKAVLLQKLKQSSRNKDSHNKEQKKKKMSAVDLIENPFVDMEAEESSDGEHSGDEDEDDRDDLEQDSFIVNDESLLEEPVSHISNEEEEEVPGQSSRKKRHGDIYRQSLMSDDIGVRNGKHWMNRFDADKWLNAYQENDSFIEEEEEEELSVERIDDFTSELDLANKLPSDPISQDEDDDFM